MALSERTLRSILSHDPAYTTEQPLSEKYPTVSVCVGGGGGCVCVYMYMCVDMCEDGFCGVYVCVHV